MKKAVYLLCIMTSLPFLSGCGCVLPERITPVYAPQVGGITESSIDQRCRVDVITKAASDLFNFYKNNDKGNGQTILIQTVDAPNADEIADYVLRTFAKNGIVLEKYFDEGIAGAENILAVYPIVDGSLNSETREKLGEERGCEVSIHARLADGKDKKIYWTKDFSAKKFVNVLRR